MEYDLSELTNSLSRFPKCWDGKESIMSMRENGYPHWRQMEWIGFFFQYLCDNRLRSAGMKTPGTRYGNAEFDGNLWFDWDFKAHPIHDKEGRESNTLIANDLEATEKSLERYGRTGLIVACGEATFDNPQTMPFREWLTALKGGESAYSLANRKRGARKRLYKTSFKLAHIDIYILEQQDIAKQGLFQSGMRNSDGRPRRPKVSLELNTISPARRIHFS